MQSIKRPATHHGGSSKSLLTQNTTTTTISIVPPKAPNLMREGISVQHQVTILSKEAKSLMDAGKFAEAIECLNVAIQLNNSHVSLINRAHCKKHLKNFEGAIEDFTLALRLDPANITCFNQRGICYSKLQKYEYAIRDLNSAYEIEPSMQIAFNRANIYSEARDFHAGIREFSRIIDMDPGDLKYRCMYQRANIYIEVEEYSLAIHDLRLVLMQDPNSFAPRVLLGKAYMGLCDFEKAEESFSHAVLIDSKKTDVYIERGNARCRIGTTEKIILAIEDYSMAIKIISERKTQRKMSAVLYANTVVHLLNQEEKKNDSTRNLFSKQDTRKSMHKDKDAPSSLTPYIMKINASLAVLHSKRSLARLIIEPSSEAILQDALHDALEARDYQPNNAEYKILLAKCYIRLRRYEDAIEVLTEVVSTNPTCYSALYQLAFVHRINNNIVDAIDCLTKIIAHHNDEADTGPNSFILRVYELRGTLLYEQSAYKYALADFGRAINICPSRADNYFFRAQCHSKLGNFEQSVYDFEMAEKYGFSDGVNMLLSKGIVAKLMGEYDLAIEAFTAASTILDTQQMPNIRLKYRIIMFRALCHIDQKQYSVAHADLYALRKELECSNDPACDSSMFWILYYHIALTLHMTKHYAEAAEYLQQCIDVLADSAPDSAAYGAALYYYSVENSILAEEECDSVDYVSYITQCISTAWAASPHFEMLCLLIRGKAYQRMHMHHQAIEDFTRAIELQQEDANAYIYFRRGWSHKAIKEFVAAGIDFETAKRLRPHDPNFNVDYKNVNNIEYIFVRTEPDIVEPFVPILEAVKTV